jgi:hypothetical protein
LLSALTFDPHVATVAAAPVKMRFRAPMQRGNNHAADLVACRTWSLGESLRFTKDERVAAIRHRGRLTGNCMPDFVSRFTEDPQRNGVNGHEMTSAAIPDTNATLDDLDARHGISDVVRLGRRT